MRFKGGVMTAAGHISMGEAGAKEFALSQVDPCVAIDRLTHPPAFVSHRILPSRFAPCAEAAMATRTQGSAASLDFF
jgi:hypothetical protein